MNDMIPPAPDGFEWRETPEGLGLTCQPLERVASHCFTTRAWVLGKQTPDTVASAAWDQVARAIGVQPSRLVRLQQVHGHAIAHALAGIDPPVADIVVNGDPELAVAVQSADCVPLLFADTRTGAVAAAHAGWRGMVARVPQVTVEAMATLFGTRPSDIVVAAGPSIGACCYQVGTDVREAFIAAGLARHQVGSWFHEEPVLSSCNPPMPGRLLGREREKWFFDGWTAVRAQLESAGVAAESIFMAGLCTASHPRVFCSYRRDGAPAGRLAGVIRPGGRR